MSNYQQEKKLILDYYKSLDIAQGDNISKVLESYIAKDYIWRGYHPFNELSNAKEVSETFW